MSDIGIACTYDIHIMNIDYTNVHSLMKDIDGQWNCQNVSQLCIQLYLSILLSHTHVQGVK